MATSLRLEAPSASPLLSRLASYGPLPPEEFSHIEHPLDDARGSRAFAANQDLRLSGDPQGAGCWALDTGWAGCVALMEDGRRQIVDLAIPGDIINSFEVARFGLTVQALTDVRVRDVSKLAALIDATPKSALADAWRAAAEAVNARRIRHLVRLGGMLAFERTVDFLLELRDRQARSDAGSSNDLAMPLTQEALSDYLGLSVVHLNRVMQRLRKDGLINYRPGRVTLANPASLRATIGRACGTLRTDDLPMYR